MLTHGSLFTGIGGIDLGFERAGIKTIWQVENDKYAVKVLEKNFPKVRRYGDIREVKWEEVDCPDIISGGFPCQDISTANTRTQGIKGERSGLWSYYKQAIRVLRPRYALIENVSVITKRGLNTVMEDLAEIGYDAEWCVISACQFGSPHTRERMFIVAHPMFKRFSFRLCESGDFNKEGKQMEEAIEDERRLRINIGKSCIINKGRKIRFQQWEIEPDVGRVADGIPDRVDRIKCLGNAVVPQVAEYIGRRIVEFDKAIDSRRTV